MSRKPRGHILVEPVHGRLSRIMLASPDDGGAPSGGEGPRPPDRIFPPVPRGKICEKMCVRRPFRPDGTGYAQEHPDLPRIYAAVEAGLPFYCHETVLMDERTTFDAEEENPEPPMQPHFEGCRGAHERRMSAWVKKAADAFHITEEEVRRRAGLSREARDLK